VDYDNNNLTNQERQDLSHIIKAASFSGNKVQRINKVWAKIMKDIGTVKTGTMLYYNLFMLAPETKNLFPKFSNMEGEQLRSNDSFQKQVKLAITAISNAIMSLDDNIKLKGMLSNLGKLFKSKGVSLETLHLVGNALMATLEAALGNESCIETLNFFALFFNEGFHMLADGYDN